MMGIIDLRFRNRETSKTLNWESMFGRPIHFKSRAPAFLAEHQNLFLTQFINSTFGLGNDSLFSPPYSTGNTFCRIWIESYKFRARKGQNRKHWRPDLVINDCGKTFRAVRTRSPDLFSGPWIDKSNVVRINAHRFNQIKMIHVNVQCPNTILRFADVVYIG